MGKPLDGKQNVSRNTDVYKRYQGYNNENLLEIEFTEGEVASKNYGRDVSLDKLSKDRPDHTGPEQGFFQKNKQLRKNPR